MAGSWNFLLLVFPSHFWIISNFSVISHLFPKNFCHFPYLIYFPVISLLFLTYFSTLLISHLLPKYFSLVSQYFSIVCHLCFVFVKPLLPDLLNLSSLKASYIASFCYDFGAITEAVKYQVIVRSRGWIAHMLCICAFDRNQIIVIPLPLCNNTVSTVKLCDH